MPAVRRPPSAWGQEEEEKGKEEEAEESRLGRNGVGVCSVEGRRRRR